MRVVVVVTLMAYVVAAGLVCLALVPLAMIGETFPVVRVARWTGWIAVLVVVAAIAEAW